MSNIENAVNVSISTGGSLAQADDPNIICVVTTNSSIGLNANNRTDVFTDLASVGSTYGTTTAEYDIAQSIFATKKNPINAGGRVVFGYRDQTAGTPGFSAQLNSGTYISTSGVVSSLQTISDGYLSISYNGPLYDLTNLNFTGISTISDAATILSDALFNAVGLNFTVFAGNFNFDTDAIFILSPLQNSSEFIGFASDQLFAGTYVGTILQFTSGSGAQTFAGSDGAAGTAETVAAALDAINAEVACKGFMFIDAAADDAEVIARAEYAQSSGVIIYDVFSDPTELELQIGNVVWDNTLAGRKNYRTLYSKAGNRKFASSYMALQHSVNFNGENQAITMQYKELSITPESYTQEEIDKAKAVGLDIYTTIRNTPVIYTSGANDFSDNVYNIMAYLENIKIDTFNVLKGTSTKIGQKQAGVDTLVDALEKTTEKFVKAGVFGPGTWLSTEFFGDVDTFNENIELKGYYWRAGSLAAQSPADRDSRKSPVIQGAVKLVGAIHSVDILINLD